MKHRLEIYKRETTFSEDTTLSEDDLRRLIKFYEEEMTSGEDNPFLQSLKEIYEEDRERNKEVIPFALCECLESSLSIPEWLEDAICAGINRYHNFEVKSWDDIFGGRPKGTKLAALRRQQELRPKVFTRVRELHIAGEPIHKDLFDKVGEEFGIGATFAEKLYRQQLERMPPPTRPYSREV